MDGNTELYRELQPGTALNSGKYVIEKKIGEGGFGITYKAVQRGLNRYVCIKEYFLAGRCVRNTHARTIQLQGIDEEVFERFREAFVKEAQTLASLHHTNIVEVIDIFDENNTSYMVMPFIEGRSLQAIVEEKGPLSYPEAVNYIAQVTSAVAYIHDRHILHRDIKPENIMITDDYKAILIDFGSAREFQQDKTQRHTSLLTHGYAPPEQYTANSRKGSYTDIYALGASLYYILTGQVPIEAAARLTEDLIEPKFFNPKIPEEANRTIMKAMQLKVIDRYQTVQEFMDDLRNKQSTAHTDVSDGAKETNVIPQKQDDKKNKPWLKWVLIAVIIVLILAIGVNVLVHIQKQEQRAQMEKPEQTVNEENLEKLKVDYEQTVKEFDFKVENIVLDKENREGAANWVIESLKALQAIEKYENNPSFSELGIKPCFEDKYIIFQTRLINARMNLFEKNKYDLEQGKTNIYLDEVRKRLALIDDILSQTHGPSVANVQLNLR